MVLLIFAMIKDMFREIEGKRVFLFLTLALLSHTVLDYFSFDSSKPFGVPLFWPLTSEYNISPYPLFLDINRSGDSGMGFVTSLFSLHNLVALIGEAIFGLVVILISQLVNNPSSKLLKVKLLLGIFCSAVLFIGFQFSFSLPSYQ